MTAASACGSSDDLIGPGGPVSSRSSTIIAISPTQQSGLVGGRAWIAPVFQVRDFSGSPLANANVTCTFYREVGITTVEIGQTSPDGLHSCSAWTLGATPGDYMLIVNSSGATSISFVASAHDSSYFEIYDLRQVGDNPIPFTYPDSGGTVQSGRIYLSPDGTYNKVRIWNGNTFTDGGRFARSGDNLRFFDFPEPSSSYPYGSYDLDHGYFVGVGTIAGGALRFDYADSSFLDSELYLKQE